MFEPSLGLEYSGFDDITCFCTCQLLDYKCEYIQNVGWQHGLIVSAYTCRSDVALIHKKKIALILQWELNYLILGLGQHCFLPVTFQVKAMLFKFRHARPNVYRK